MVVFFPQVVELGFKVLSSCSLSCIASAVPGGCNASRVLGKSLTLLRKLLVRRSGVVRRAVPWWWLAANSVPALCWPVHDR
jgi:hypothetical protein